MKTIYLTDNFMGTGADPEQIECYLTGEKVHYFDMYHDDKGEYACVGITLSEHILKAVWERKDDLSTPLVLTLEGVTFRIIDTRFYKVFYDTWKNPDYQTTQLENDDRWLWNLEPEWVEAEENEDGITNIALKTENLQYGKHQRIVGYNGILNGDRVELEGKPYTVVMVSRLGDFGLSETGELPYSKRVNPNKVKRLSA